MKVTDKAVIHEATSKLTCSWKLHSDQRTNTAVLYMSDDYTYFNLSIEEVIAILRIIG